jgi:hypothetical protein
MEAMMGLDMYFYGKRYLWDFGDRNDRVKIEAVGKLFPEIRGAKINEITAEFMYWRKANAIHAWFVKHVQEGKDECQESYVPVGKLHELRDVCAAVLASPDQAADLLPSQGGFFFGGTEYDESYFDDVQSTLNWLNDLLLKDALNAMDGWSFYYRASW